MKKTIGIATVLAGLVLSVPAMADQTNPPSNNSMPGATGNPAPARGEMNQMPQHHDIRNDAQNYREADNDKNQNWKEHEEQHHKKMEERREHHREMMKERRERHEEKMKEQHHGMTPGENH